MKTALRKVWRDLWRNFGRTVLVVLSIAVGVLALGMIVSSNTIIARQLAVSNAAMQPSHAQLFLSGAVDQATVDNLARLPEIEAIEGRLATSIRWKASPDGEWQDGTLRAINDYTVQSFDLIELLSGTWPQRGTIDVSFNHVEPFGVPTIGQTIFLEVNEREKTFVLGGTVRDPVELAPPFATEPTFYVSVEEFEKMRGLVAFGQLRLTVPEYSQEAIDEVSALIETNLRRQDVTIDFIQNTDPQEHFFQSTMDGVNLILTVMAVASLILSTFLVVNTMNALLVQQVPQIGIMKTIGGLSRQIATVYLSGVTIYGLMSLLVAVPLGALAGEQLSSWFLNVLNVQTTPFELLPEVFVIQAGVGLLTPLLAALWPVFRGVQIPVARAISAFGIGQGQYGGRLLDRLLSRIRGMPRLVMLTLRNTFRRPGRVIMTEVTLVAAGAVFMMVLSTAGSFNNTIDKIFAGFGFDVFLVFEQPQRIDEIIPKVESRPGIDVAEMWVFSSGFGRPLSADDSEELEIVLRGIPRGTLLFTPELVEGRDLDLLDGHAMLLNQKIAADMELGVGDQLVLDISGSGESTWTIVGLILDLAPGPDQNSAYIFRDVLNQELNQIGQAGVVEVRGSEQTIALQQAIEEDLTSYFEAEGTGVAFTSTALESKEQANAQFTVLTTILLVMTVLIAFVGSFGLSGTLSINVIERRREIGVMRAVGASSWDVGRVFVGEGLILGVMSWALSIPLGVSGGRVFVDLLGGIIDFPFSYQFSSQAVWLWLGIVIVLALVASWLPSRRATRISVRESLAYE
jgi:putative ABC transport system permease protein